MKKNRYSCQRAFIKSTPKSSCANTMCYGCEYRCFMLVLFDRYSFLWRFSSRLLLAASVQFFFSFTIARFIVLRSCCNASVVWIYYQIRMRERSDYLLCMFYNGVCDARMHKRAHHSQTYIEWMMIFAPMLE